MSYFPDLSRGTYVSGPDAEHEYVSVGWLGSKVEHAGETQPRVRAALRRAADAGQRDWGPIPAGPHTCEICGNHMEHHEFVVPNGRLRYLIPNMIFHYIDEHGYRLPAEVEQALLEPATRG